MDKVHLAIFSLDRTSLTNYVKAIRDICEKKGVDSKGPATPPPYRFTGPLTEKTRTDWLEDTPKHVRALEIDDSDFSRLQSADQATHEGKLNLFSRHIELYDETAVREVMKLALPDSVCLHVNMNTFDYHIGGENSPYTYNPGHDHVTDLDFEVHHS